MQLTDLSLNRNLYKTLQDTSTQGADQLASNVAPMPSSNVASGNTVTDINTNAQLINGAQLEPGTYPVTTLDIANWGWNQTCIFTVTDDNTISWANGAFISADGTAYSIGLGDTGNMAAKTYVYLDINVSTTAYQITTSVNTTVGIGKVLIAVCQNTSSVGTGATFNLVQASQITADNILANSINANKITAGSITTTQLSATAIDAMTITGALIRTDTGAVGHYARITMDGSTNTFNAYDSSNNRIVNIGSSSGTVLKITPVLSNDYAIEIAPSVATRGILIEKSPTSTGNSIYLYNQTGSTGDTVRMDDESSGKSIDISKTVSGTVLRISNSGTGASIDIANHVSSSNNAINIISSSIMPSLYLYNTANSSNSIIDIYKTAGAGSSYYLTHTSTTAGTIVGASYSIINNGTGDIKGLYISIGGSGSGNYYAFDINGANTIYSASSVSGLGDVIKVRVGGSTKYIPCYSSYA